MHVFSVDTDSIQEYTKWPALSTTSMAGAHRAYHLHHIVHPVLPKFDLMRCLVLSDVVMSAVPSTTSKVCTAALKDGCMCINIAGGKNFEVDVQGKVHFAFFFFF